MFQQSIILYRFGLQFYTNRAVHDPANLRLSIEKTRSENYGIKMIKINVRRKAEYFYLFFFLKIKTKSSQCVGANKNYKPVGTDITLDFCQIAEGAGHPFVKMFLPDIREILGDTLHPCPYSVW
jgi:hypothetical protein